MKKYINKTNQIIVALLFLFFVSCETIDTDLIDNPSTIGPEDATLEFLFNSTQISLAGFFETAQFPLAQVTRMELMSGAPTYENQFGAGRFNGLWTTAYATFLNDNKLLRTLASEIETENINGNNFIAVSQIMEAYVITTLADIFGGIPYSEALQGSDNFNPKRDDDVEIYNVSRNLLENAVLLIDDGGSVNLTNDLYYNGNMERWRKLANSLLIKLAVQARLNDTSATTARLNSLLADNEFIGVNSEDFQFDYSDISSNPDSRHGTFVAQYVGGAGTHLSAPFMRRMENDPRFRYYFYHQDGIIFGREHGDAGPNVASEFPHISVQGLYPAGGKYNSGTSFPATNPNNGAKGAGASIMMTNFNTKFLIAEGQLMMNNNVAASRSALEDAINASMDKVTGFRTFAVPSGEAVSGADITSYINDAMTRFDNASGNQAKLDVIITESYKSLWGNGIEVYNNYRRTGYPSDLQASVSAAGTFTHSMKYPSVYIDNNNNPDAEQHSIGEKVWWAEGTTFNLNF